LYVSLLQEKKTDHDVAHVLSNLLGVARIFNHVIEGEGIYNVFNTVQYVKVYEGSRVMRQRVTCVSVGPPLADRRLPVEMTGC
jgi:hypothetical protein